MKLAEKEESFDLNRYWQSPVHVRSVQFVSHDIVIASQYRFPGERGRGSMTSHLSYCSSVPLTESRQIKQDYDWHTLPSRGKCKCILKLNVIVQCAPLIPTSTRQPWALVGISGVLRRVKIGLKSMIAQKFRHLKISGFRELPKYQYLFQMSLSVC